MPIALITGASRGIGCAIRQEFIEQGWQVICPSREELDLSDRQSVGRWCSGFQATNVDAFIHSAGINRPHPLEGIDDTDWEDTFQVNVTALRQLVQCVVPLMPRGGHVLALGSIYGIISRPERAAYSAAKSAVNGLIRALSVELGPRGLLVNALCPGFIATDMTRRNNTPEQLDAIAAAVPLRRLGTPQEIAKLAAWLCSSGNTYLTGQAIICDGGYTIQ